MTDTSLYSWHSLAVVGDADEIPEDPQCGWYIRKKRRESLPAIIVQGENGLQCFIGMPHKYEEVDVNRFWPLLAKHPTTEKYFVGTGGYDPRKTTREKPETDTIPEFKSFDGGDGLLEYISDFVSKCQKWVDINKVMSDRETAYSAGTWLKKSRALAAMLIQFKGQASDKQYEQIMGQLQTVADGAKLIIAPWVSEHEDEEIAGLNKNNIKVEKERYAKIEDLDAVVKHYLEKRHKILISTIEKMCNYDAKRNRKVPGMKVLIREVGTTND